MPGKIKLRTKKKIYHTLVSFILIILLIIFSLHFYVKRNSSMILKSYLNRILNKNGVVYKIEHNYVDLDLIGGQIVLKNIKISFDKEYIRSSGIKQKILFNVSIPLLSITGISYFDFLMFRKIKADRILMKKGKLKIYIFPVPDSNKKNGEKRSPPPSLSLRRLTIENLDVEFYTQLDSAPKSAIRDISADSARIEYNPGKTIDENFNGKLPGLKLTANGSCFNFSRTGYKAETGRINFSSSGPSVSIKGFKYEPASSESRIQLISERGGFHRFSIEKIDLKIISEKELIKNNRFQANQLYMVNPDINIFRNRNIKKKITPSGGKLPQQIFRESKIGTEINLIRMEKGTIRYTEIAPGEKKAESIFFTSVDLSMKNISNFKEKLRTGNESLILLSANLLGESKLKAKIVIPVNHRRDEFSFSGTLDRTDPGKLNRYLRRNVKIRIDRGIIDHMGFAVKADRDSATGLMKLYYRNMKVTLLRKNDPERKSKFRTFLANTLTYGSNPAKKGKKPREGKIQYNREVKKSIVNYMWQCILSGITSSIKR